MSLKPFAPTPAMADVFSEREKQRGKWGDRHDDEHTHHDWIALMARWAASNAGRFNIRHFRASMVAVGALALAAIEWCDRILAREEAVVDRFVAEATAKRGEA